MQDIFPFSGLLLRAVMRLRGAVHAAPSFLLYPLVPCNHCSSRSVPPSPIWYSNQITNFKVSTPFRATVDSRPRGRRAWPTPTQCDF
jgi:hypothetical protein